MWFVFALIYAVFIAIVIVFDRFIVTNIFTRPLQGLFITIPTSVAVILGLGPLIVWPEPRIFALAFISGFFLQASQACYFYALDKADEAGDMSAVEATYPVIIAVASIFLGNYLAFSEWIGILIVVTAVMALSWERLKKPDLVYFGFLAADVLFLACHGLMAHHALKEIPFLSFYGPYSIAIVLFGLLPFIVSKTERHALLDNWKNIRKVLPHLSLMEIANILGIISAVYALSIGHPAMVTAVMTTYPAMVFIFGALLVKIPFFRAHGFEPVENIYRKLAITFVIAGGLGLIVI
jgi:uncharacterized membrane protein